MEVYSSEKDESGAGFDFNAVWNTFLAVGIRLKLTAADREFMNENLDIQR